LLLRRDEAIHARHIYAPEAQRHNGAHKRA
jgi:hypothetical protein